eukprot:TRINITY_DN102409_c0_g1_i1.p1 TRINITY_DN102409_c0_g1~~TRINITY_DN102409_c0_g1_i1.p1  ORF type:complete len:1765 (-),score=532.08 TRINITY_DN102409_c0_g1_i1:203-5497(-)
MAESSQTAAMEVDQTGARSSEDDSAAGLRVYQHILREVLRPLDLGASQAPGVQLHAYRLAAKIFDARDALLSFLRGEKDGAEVPELMRTAAAAVKDQLTASGTWPQSSALKGKRVFGHKKAIKFFQLPLLPANSQGKCVFLPERPQSTSGLFMFGKGEHAPLAELEVKQSALILPLDSILPGAVVVIAPSLAGASAPSELEESRLASELTEFIQSASDAWRKLARSEPDLFSTASARLIGKVTKGGPAANSSSTVTPRKPVKETPASAPSESNAAGELESPAKEENLNQPSARTERTDEVDHLCYSTLLASLCKEMTFYTESFQGAEYLDSKKQLLVYYHSARLHEQRDAVLAAIRGEMEQASALDDRQLRVVEAVRQEITDTMNKAGQKLKRIFQHDHVIKYHSVKGLPVHRTSCVFLRERPQTHTEILRKTPSVFTELIRFRAPGSALIELEERGMAVVLNLTDYKPRAALVISPLFEQIDLLEKVADSTWGEIQEILKDKLAAMITQESDAWRSFIQRHADLVSTHSLKIIQKTLKNCVPGSGMGEFGHQLAMDIEAAEQARQMAEMGREMAAMYLADREGQWMRSEGERQDEHEAMHLLAKAQEAADKKAEKFRKKALEARKVAEEAANEKIEEARREQLREIDQAHRARDEAQAALARQEVELNKSKEEVLGLSDAQQEVLHAFAKMESLTSRERKAIKVKNSVLKQQIKQSQRLQRQNQTKIQELERENKDSIKQLEKEQKRAAEFEKQAQETFETLADAEVERTQLLQKIEAAAEFEQKTREQLAEFEKTSKDAIGKLAAVEAERTAERTELLGKIEAAAEMEQKSKEQLVEFEKTVKEASDKLAAIEAERAEMLDKIETAATAAKESEKKATAAWEVADEMEKKASAAGERATMADKLASEARAAEAKALAEMQVKADAAKHLSDLNVTLRTQMAEAKDAVTSAEEAANKARESEAQIRADLSACQDQVQAAGAKTEEMKKAVDAAEAKADASCKEVEEFKTKASAAQAVEVRVRAELSVAKDEAARLSAQVAKAAADAAAVSARADAEAKKRHELASQVVQLQADHSMKIVQLQAELSNKTEAMARLQTSNRDLRVEMAETRDREDAALRQQVEAEKKVAAGNVTIDALNADLKQRDQQLEELRQKCEDAEAKAAEASKLASEAEESVHKAQATAAAGDAAAENSPPADHQNLAELQVAKEEASRLNQSCATLRNEVAREKVLASQAQLRASAAEQSITEARREIIQKQAELEVAQTALAMLQSSKAELRAELAGAKQAAEEAELRANKANGDVQQCHIVQVDAKKEVAEARCKVSAAEAEVDKLRAELEQLRKAKAEPKAALDSASARASEAEEAAAASRAEEIKAKAYLAAKTEEAQRLSDACAKLRSEAAEAAKKAQAAEQRAAKAEAERKVALAASELTEAEVQHFAAWGEMPKMAESKESEKDCTKTNPTAILPGNFSDDFNFEADLEAALQMPMAVTEAPPTKKHKASKSLQTGNVQPNAAMEDEKEQPAALSTDDKLHPPVAEVDKLEHEADTSKAAGTKKKRIASPATASEPARQGKGKLKKPRIPAKRKLAASKIVKSSEAADPATLPEMCPAAEELEPVQQAKEAKSRKVASSAAKAGRRDKGKPRGPRAATKAKQVASEVVESADSAKPAESETSETAKKAVVRRTPVTSDGSRRPLTLLHFFKSKPTTSSSPTAKATSASRIANVLRRIRKKQSEASNEQRGHDEPSEAAIPRQTHADEVKAA